MCYDVCPSGTYHLNKDINDNDEHSECVQLCPDSHPFIYESKECVEDCWKKNEMNSYNGYCVSKCNDYVIPSEHKCVDKCSGKYYLTNDKKECLDKCESPLYITPDNKCVDTCPSNAKYHIQNSQICVANCALTSYPYLYEGEGVCLSKCYEGHKFYNNTLNEKICIASCTDDYSLTYGTTNQCVKECGGIYPYQHEETCVNKCPVYVSKDNKCVTSCNVDNGEFLIEDTKQCVTSCPKEYPYYNMELHLCLKYCKDDAKKYYTNNGIKQCVKTCPEDFPLNVITTKECVKTCPSPYNLTDSITKECIASCYGNVPYHNEDKHECLPHCDGDTFEVQDKMKCVIKCNSSYYTVENLHQCVKDCSLTNGYNLIDNHHRECLDDCSHGKDGYNLRYNNLCNNKCPEFTQTIGNTCEFDLNFTSRTEDFIITSKEKDAIIVDIKNVITDLSRVGETIKGSDFILQAYPTHSPIKSNKYTSTFDFSECDTKLRETGVIGVNEEIIIVKFDNINNSSITNEVEYDVYTTNGKTVDISVCSDINVVISYPLHNEEQMKFEVAFDIQSKYGIDIYDSESPFYNDLCSPFQVNDTDVLLSERRKEYYLNVSLCPDDCENLGINYTDKTVNCNCKLVKDKTTKKSVNGNNILPIDEAFLNEDTPMNLNVLKCVNVLLNTNNLVDNISFWTCTVTLAITVIAEVCVFLIEKIKQFKNILSIISGNPPRRNVHNDSQTSNELNNVIGYDREYLEHDQYTTEEISNSLRYSYYNNNNNNNHPISNYNSNTNSFDMSHSKDASGKSFVSSSNDDFVSNVLQDYDEASSIEQHQQHKPKPKRKGAGRSNNNNNNNNNNSSIQHDESTLTNNNNNYTDTQSDDVLYYTFFKQNHIDNYPYRTACELDDRSHSQIYCKYLKEQMLALRICFKSTPFDITSVQVLNYILYFNLECIFNGMFYFNKYIQYRYEHSGKFHLTKTILNSFLSFLISIIIVNVVSKCISHRKIMETLIVELEKKEDREMMSHKAIQMFMKRMVLINIFALLVGMFSWYYLTLFNGIYKGTQIEWFIGCLLSLVLEMVVTLIYVLVMTCLRKVALKKGKKSLYNVALYIRKVFCYN